MVFIVAVVAGGRARAHGRGDGHRGAVLPRPTTSSSSSRASPSQISARRGVVTVFLFLAAALVAGRLATRLRTQVLALRAANAHATRLQALGRQLPPRRRGPGARRSASWPRRWAATRSRCALDAEAWLTGRRQARRCRRAAARGHRPGGRRLGAAPRTAGRPLHRYAVGVGVVVRCRCRRAARRSASRRCASRRAARAGARAATQLAEAMVRATSRRGRTAHAAGFGSRRRARAGRDRAPALGAAVVGLARPALAAGVDDRSRQQPGRYGDAMTADDRREPARHHRSSKASGWTATSRTCST